MTRTLARGTILVAALALAAVCSAAEEETAGNNLSFPAIFAEGIGLGGSTTDVDTGLRTPPTPDGLFAGAFWYGWLDGATQMVCDPALAACPPGAVDLQRLYLQQDESNVWQAQWSAGVPGVPVEVTGVDWGDNLESTTWSTRSFIRVETVLYQTQAVPMNAYEMWFVSGQGPNEMQGARTSNGGSPVPVILASTEATVFSPCARLTIQKLEAGAGSLASPPSGAALAWNAVAGQWDGAAYTVFNGAIWEGFASEGPSGGYSSEVNVVGKLIAGYNWQLRNQNFPQYINKIGWYRLSYSLDPTGKCGGLAPIALNTSLATAVVIPPAEGEEEAIAAAAEEPQGGFTAQVDAANNLTYIDIYVESQSATCGDGVINDVEQCDDGNLVDGDCCSSGCQLEGAGSACTDDANVCTNDVCSAAGVCQHLPNTVACDDGNACTSGDVCAAGACGGEPVACDACHTCDPVVGCSPDPDGTPCQDGNVCTQNDTCDGGVCGGGAAVQCSSCFVCNPSEGCVDRPRTECRHAMVHERSRLQLYDPKGQDRDRLQWTWRAGAATPKADFASLPTGENGYELCLYDANGLVLHAETDVQTCSRTFKKSCWKEQRSGFTYQGDAKNPVQALRRIRLREGVDGRSQLFVDARGPMLDLSSVPRQVPLTAQLRNRATNVCWHADHDRVVKNRGTRFEAKGR